MAVMTEIAPTVLVVDDSRTIRSLFNELLKDDFGLNVMLAKDGLDAIEKVQAQCPDLIIMDIVMPRMNGYELCRKLRDDPNTKGVPIIMLSSKDQEFDRYWGLKQGADAYITRPCRREELVTTIRKLLEPRFKTFLETKLSQSDT